MEKLDSGILSEMVEKVDLLEYASQSFEFKKRGYDSFATNCPLHVDKTPSLFITPSKNLYHCMSCGVSGNIINWMRTFENMSFQDAANKLAQITNSDISKAKICESLAFYKKINNAIETTKIVEKEIPRNKLSMKYDYEDKYSDEIPREWLEEGISARAMKKYEIRIDHKANRIVYPLYDKNLNFIAVKGRTRFKQYKEMNLAKYQTYQKIGTTDFFVGMKQNQNAILSANKVIIFEGIKSCMKADEWGYNYCLAAETSCLNENQILILLRMRINEVIIAFDSDVNIDKLRVSLKRLIRFTNVYIVNCKKIGEKLAPVDKGRDVWEQLLSQKKRM